MKVGFDVSPLYLDHKVRGIGFYTQRLLAELKKFKGLKIKELKNKAEINKGDYGLLHIPYFHPYFFTLPLRKKKPLVVTIHDLITLKYSKHYPAGIKGKLRWGIQKRLFKKIDWIITDSFASKNDIVRLIDYPADKITVIYLAADNVFQIINEKKRLEKISKKYCLPKRFVLYVGDINWNKNIKGLVEAFQKLKTQMPNVKTKSQILNLVLVGKAFKDKNLKEAREIFELIKDLNLINQIKILGYVPTEDLVAIYNLSSVYCQPSFDEGFGLPVLEAMACGCPVVSSNRGSLPEIVGDAAILTPPTVTGLAKSLEMILVDRSLQQKLINKGLEREKQFSWERCARETVKVYKNAYL